MKLRSLRVSLILTTALALLSFVAWQSSSPTIAWTAETYQFSSGTPTDQERRELALAVRAGDPLPDGWSLVSFDGEVSVKPTKLATPTGTRQYKILVRDDGSDLESASVYKDGVLQDNATRANGKIVDSGSTATATLLFLASTTGSHEYKLEWVSSAGQTLTSKLSIP